MRTTSIAAALLLLLALEGCIAIVMVPMVVYGVVKAATDDREYCQKAEGRCGAD